MSGVLRLSLWVELLQFVLLLVLLPPAPVDVGSFGAVRFSPARSPCIVAGVAAFSSAGSFDADNPLYVVGAGSVGGPGVGGDTACSPSAWPIWLWLSSALLLVLSLTMRVLA